MSTVPTTSPGAGPETNPHQLRLASTVPVLFMKLTVITLPLCVATTLLTMSLPVVALLPTSALSVVVAVASLFKVVVVSVLVVTFDVASL